MLVQIGEYYARNSKAVDVPFHRPTSYEKSPKNMCIKFYNNLKNEYKTLFLSRFKRVIKNVLTDRILFSERIFE